MTPAGALARAAAATCWSASPRDVRDRVVDLVADCVAVTALGSGRPELRRLVAAHERWTPSGAATVVGSPRGWPSATAAFLNACAGAADQLQEGHRLARGHPASHVVPAVLAISEERDASGEEVLSAVLAGYEAGVRVGRAMGGTPDGVHDIGTWGQVAVAMAVAHLLAPGDVDAAQRALDLSASAVLLTDARTVFAGTTGSHAFLGTSVQAGSALGMAAVAGLDAGPGSLERHLGTVAARAWRSEALGKGVGETWTTHEVLGGYLKVHPTCAHLHGVNDAVADLLATGVGGVDVRDVEVRVGAPATEFDAVAEGELAARFSVPTSVAIALITGRLDETAMDDVTVRSPAVRALATRVSVVHDPALDVEGRAGRPARVRVVLRDGSVHETRADRPRGDADRALSRDVLAAKATRLLTHRFAGAGEGVLAAAHALAAGGDARSLGAALREAAA